MTENTFLGLQPYTEADAYRFKGRTEESQELFRLIVRNDYTVCYAESGEGKTSLLNAGVFPLLRQNMYFPIAITFTSDDYERTPDNFDTIIDRCIKDSIDDYNEQNKGVSIEYKICSTDFQDTGCQPALQQELSKYSWWKMRNYKPQAMGLTFTPVFVFDQFEEVFNLPGSIVWTKKFFDWLEDVSSDSCPGEIVNKVREIIGANAAFPAIKEEKDFKAVFSLRKEFIGELDYWCMQKCFIPSLKDNRYCLKALTYEGAKKVMTQQQRFEETKVEQVLSYFVQQYSREPEKTLAEKLPAIPALLLSVVCDSWEKDIDFFSGKGENEIGQSLNKILERFYEEAISSITNELFKQEANSQPELIREEIETAIFALVDSNGKRVRRKSSELSHLDFDAKYKEILSNKRIIKTSKVDGEDYVEIVHDSLCPIIAKRKREREIKRIKEESERELQAQKERMRHRTRVLWMTVGCVVFFAISYWLICIGLKSRIPFDPNKIGYRETVPVFSRLYKVKDSTLVLRNCYVSPYTFIDNPEVRKLVLDGVLFYDNSFCFPNLDTIVIENGQYFVGYFNYNFIKDSVSVVIARRPMFNDTNSKVYRLNIVKHVGKVLIASEDSSYLKWYNGVLLVKNNKDVWESILYNDDVDYYTDTIEFGCNVPHPFWALLDYDIANPPHVEDSDSLIKKYNKRLRWHLVCSDTNDTSLCSSDVPASGGIEVDLPYIKKIAPNTFNFNNCVVYNAFFQRLEEVGDYAFYWQKNLHSIKMPNVRKIGASAFYRCYDLKLVILDSLRELMGQAFNYCDSLKTLYLPVVDTIGEFALPCHPPVYKWGWNLNSKNHVNFCNTFAKDGFPKNQMDSIKDSDSVRDVSSDKVLMDGYSFTRIGDWNNKPLWWIMFSSDTILTLKINHDLTALDNGLKHDTAIIKHPYIQKIQIDRKANKFNFLLHGVLFSPQKAVVAESREKAVSVPKEFKSDGYCLVNVFDKRSVRKFYALDRDCGLELYKSKHVTLYVPYGQLSCFNPDGWCDVKELSVIQTIYYRVFYWLPLKMHYYLFSIKNSITTTNTNDIIAFATCGLFLALMLLVVHWLGWRLRKGWKQWLFDMLIIILCLVVAGLFAYACHVSGNVDNTISMWPVWWFAPAIWLVYLFVSEIILRKKCCSKQEYNATQNSC